MNQKDRMLRGLPYKAWLDGLREERELCKTKIYELNMLLPKDRGKIPAILKDLFGKTGENVWIEPPFHCDYGWNIEVGENFFANYGLTVLDTGKVIIGDNVVIGAGSVVTKSIPNNMIAMGNPCKIIREITDKDEKFYYKDREFDVGDY